MERPDELRALAVLAAAELGGAAGGIGGVHDAIAQRVFGALGGRAEPVRRAHDTIAQGAYASVGVAATLGGAAAGRLLALRDAGDGRPVSASPRGAAALGVLCGLCGDALEASGSDLAEPMALRVRGRAVPPERAALAAAYPGAGPRLVVFLHGLMETEFAWRLGGAGGLRRPAGGRPRLHRARRPLQQRPPHLAERALAGRAARAGRRRVARRGRPDRARRPLDGRPRRAQRLPPGRRGGDRWAGRVRHVVSLGTPHGGAPLAQGTHLAAHALHALPETRPFARFLRRRSAGIRDLRHGSLVDSDWDGHDPDALRAAACAEVPLLPGATHCFVAATVTRDARHPVGRVLGDWLVLAPSASGRGRTRPIPFRAEDGLSVGGTHHLALLNHPAVYTALRGWLATPPRAGVAPDDRVDAAG